MKVISSNQYSIPPSLQPISKWFSLQMKGFQAYVMFKKIQNLSPFFWAKGSKFWPHGNRSSSYGVGGSIGVDDECQGSGIA